MGTAPAPDVASRRLKPGLFAGFIVALKRHASTVVLAFLLSPAKVNGGGQECPPHTGNVRGGMGCSVFSFADSFVASVAQIRVQRADANPSTALRAGSGALTVHVESR
jgi:hypothetical protein